MFLAKGVTCNSPDNLFHVNNMFKLAQEPLVDFSESMDLVYGSTGMHRVRNGENSLV
jgi:hypothetical protein